MIPKNLEEAIQAAGSPVELLRNSQMGPNVYPVIPAEYSNWRAEQTAWQQILRSLQSVVPHDRHVH